MGELRIREEYRVEETEMIAECTQDILTDLSPYGSATI